MTNKISQTLDQNFLEEKIISSFKKNDFKLTLKYLILKLRNKNDSTSLNRLGVALDKLNKKKFAEIFYLKSIEYDELNPKPYFNLAILKKNTDTKQSLNYLDKVIQINNSEEAKVLKSNILLKDFKYNEIISLLKNPTTDEAFFLLGISYYALNDKKKGLFYLEKSILRNDLYINFCYLNFFPRIYDNSKEINFFRNKFKYQLDKIEEILENKNNDDNHQGIIQSSTNFYLSYQQKNDLGLNQKYFELLKKINCKNNIKIKKFNKNKIIFISSFFFRHTVSKLFFNFIKEFSEIQKFNVYILHTSNKNDAWTNEYKKLNLNYVNIVDLNNIQNFLEEEKFEYIFFLDHSMSNITQGILVNKFSKKYFMLWGHPVTTGSNNVDYFISSKLMDNNNQKHYSEKLILVDDIGFKFKIDEYSQNLNKADSNFAIIQSLFKLLPKYDYIYGKILKENPLSKLYFIKDNDPHYTNKFISRLKKNKMTKKYFDRILFLNRMDQEDFFKSVSSFKVILDSIGWSGGNTTMEALFLNKPIVTMKGNNLRSNHTAAILKKMDLKVLVSNNYFEYIYISKKLLKDQNFYNEIVNKIKENKAKIFNNNLSLYESLKEYI